jgi:hypothetical protein
LKVLSFSMPCHRLVYFYAGNLYHIYIYIWGAGIAQSV